MGVPADDDGLDPAGHQAGDVLADDGLPEHRASQDVADGAVGRTPHLLELELLHAILIWRNCGALDAHAVPLDRLRRLHRHPVVCRISVLHTEVIASREEIKRKEFELIVLERTLIHASMMSRKCVVIFFFLLNTYLQEHIICIFKCLFCICLTKYTKLQHV